jgi:hypothetical protein
MACINQRGIFANPNSAEGTLLDPGSIWHVCMLLTPVVHIAMFKIHRLDKSFGAIRVDAGAMVAMATWLYTLRT